MQPLIIFLILFNLLRIPISSLPLLLLSFYLACDCWDCQTQKPRDLASIWSWATEFQDFEIFSVARFWQIHFALYNFIKHGQILAFIDMNPNYYLLLCLTQILYFAKNKASHSFQYQFQFLFNGYYSLRVRK